MDSSGNVIALKLSKSLNHDFCHKILAMTKLYLSIIKLKSMMKNLVLVCLIIT